MKRFPEITVMVLVLMVGVASALRTGMPSGEHGAASINNTCPLVQVPQHTVAGVPPFTFKYVDSADGCCTFCVQNTLCVYASFVSYKCSLYNASTAVHLVPSPGALAFTVVTSAPPTPLPTTATPPTPIPTTAPTPSPWTAPPLTPTPSRNVNRFVTLSLFGKVENYDCTLESPMARTYLAYLDTCYATGGIWSDIVAYKFTYSEEALYWQRYRDSSTCASHRAPTLVSVDCHHSRTRDYSISTLVSAGYEKLGHHVQLQWYTSGSSNYPCGVSQRLYYTQNWTTGSCQPTPYHQGAFAFQFGAQSVFFRYYPTEQMLTYEAFSDTNCSSSDGNRLDHRAVTIQTSCIQQYDNSSLVFQHWKF